MADVTTLEERLRALAECYYGSPKLTFSAAAEALEEAARKIEERLGNTSAGFVADELRQLARELREGVGK